MPAERDPSAVLHCLSSHDPLDARVDIGPAAPDARSITHLASDAVDLSDWLEEEVREVVGADAKLAAAYLLGSAAWSVCRGLGHLHFAGCGGVAIGPADVALSPRREPWEEDGEQGVATVYDVTFRPGLGWTSSPTVLDLGRAIVAIHTPLVEALHRRSRLSRGALWRLVGDSLSAALLNLGKAQGDPGQAMDAARAILGDRSSPLRSRQTGFVRIEVPEIRLPSGAPLSEWFRARGGCCRYYTSEGGEYCTTCVLRNPESRNGRLAAYLRRTHAA